MKNSSLAYTITAFFAILVWINIFIPKYMNPINNILVMIATIIFLIISINFERIEIEESKKSSSGDEK